MEKISRLDDKYFSLSLDHGQARLYMSADGLEGIIQYSELATTSQIEKMFNIASYCGFDIDNYTELMDNGTVIVIFDEIEGEADGSPDSPVV